MLTAVWLAAARWRFDLRSALIGAIIAWIIAGFLYARRQAIKELVQVLWSPVVAFRKRLQSSQESRYIDALQAVLRSRLLFNPSDPLSVFQPPTFLAPAPITEAVNESLEPPDSLRVTFDNLLAGYPYLLVTGPLASGRTTTLALLVWQNQHKAKGRKPYNRYPLWIDLARYREMKSGDDTPPLEQLAELASLAVPNLLPAWATTHLQRDSALILVDNWEILPPYMRSQMAKLIRKAQNELPQSVWVIATGEHGYGLLAEADFVPVEIVPASGPDVVKQLYSGWATLLKQPTTFPETIAKMLAWADKAGASLMELTLRIVLYLSTEQVPTLPIEVLDHLLDLQIPVLNLGDSQVNTVEHARTLVMLTLSHIAQKYRMEGTAFSRQEIDEYIISLLPPEHERPPKLRSVTRKLLFDSGLLQRQGNIWQPAHYLWTDFLTAWHIAEDEIGADMVRAHLDDPLWAVLLELYVTVGESAHLIEALLYDANRYENYFSLLRVARWGIIAPEETEWRTTLTKTLAQYFVDPDLPQAWRLRIGQSMALLVGGEALAFFITAVRQPEIPVRCAALRGIGWTGGPREVAILESALKEPELDVVISAVEALGDIGTGGAARLLYQTLAAADEHLILPIGYALAAIPEAHDLLKRAAESDDFMARRAAAHGLARLEEAWAVELLQTIAREDKEWLVRSAAETALNAREQTTDSKIVVLPPPKVDEIDWLISWAATQHMGLGVGEAAMQTLLQAVEQGDARAQILGAITLMQIGTLSHLQLLEPLLKSEDPQVQYVAAYATEIIEQRYHLYQGV